MATRKSKTTNVTKAVTSKPASKKEIGQGSLYVTTDGYVYEDAGTAFAQDTRVHTCDKMMLDATVASAFNALRSIVRCVDWYAEFPLEEGEVITDQQKSDTEFIMSCMEDMDKPWSDFISEALTFGLYGYSAHEKVFKVRKGYLNPIPSKFDDQRLGWKKLPIRAQRSLIKFKFDDEKRTLIDVVQRVNTNTYNGATGDEITIPANKLLLFVNNSVDGNPLGRTPLQSCFRAYQLKTNIEQIEATSVSRDMNGMPVIDVPPEYLSPDADQGKKNVVESLKTILNNLHTNQSMGVMMPKYVDPETKENIFGFRLESASGTKMNDTDKIIRRYESQILMAFLADVLKMGQDSVGSYALADSKTSLMSVGIKALLVQITDVLNRDLVPQTLQLNGLNVSGRIPQIVFGDLDERDIDVLSKAVQRFVSAGAVEVDQNMSDYLRKAMNIPPADPSKPLREELKASGDSQAGNGMKEGMPNTASSGSSESDTSISNGENA